MLSSVYKHFSVFAELGATNGSMAMFAIFSSSDVFSVWNGIEEGLSKAQFTPNSKQVSSSVCVTIAGVFTVRQRSGTDGLAGERALFQGLSPSFVPNGCLFLPQQVISIIWG